MKDRKIEDSRLYLAAGNKVLKELLERYKPMFPISAKDFDPFESGMRNMLHGGRATFTVERSWGVGVTAYIHLRKEKISEGRFHLDVDVNWSSTSRDLLTAQQAINLYQEMVNFCGLIKTYVDTSAFESDVFYQYKQDIAAQEEGSEEE